MNSLKVKQKLNTELLSRPEFASLSTEELLYRARLRLGLARCGAIRGIRVCDRSMAIAILLGIRDNTAFGLEPQTGATYPAELL